VFESKHQKTQDRFQPTYEGLKQPPKLPVGFSCPGFQPTYEGLKLAKRENEEGVKTVFSLPTRD